MGVYSCAKKPKFVAIENVEIQGVTDTLLMLRLDYIIYNPNRSKTELKDSEMLIYYKDTLVGKGWLENSTQLSPRDTLRIPVHFEVNIPKLAKYYPELLRYEKAKFNIKGKNEVSFAMSNVKMKFEDQIELDTREIIESQVSKHLQNRDNFKLRKVKMSISPRLGVTHFKTVIQVYNDLPFSYRLDDMQLTFYIKEKSKPIANWKLDELIVMNSMELQELTADVTTNNFNLMSGLNLKWLFLRKVDFIMEGQMEIEMGGYKFTVPIEDSQFIDLSDLVGMNR